MRQSELTIHVVNAEVEIDDLMAEHSQAPTWSQAKALALCRACRIAATGELFMTAQAIRFREMLCRSAEHYLGFLRNAEPRLVSRVEPVYDALAAGRADLARAMTAAAGTAWQRDEEYEEDHVHALLLAGHLSASAVAADLSALVERFGALSSDTADVRIDIWSALLTKDSAAFEAALQALLARFDQQQRGAITHHRLPPDEAVTLARLNFEGLAFIQLGLAEGFALQDEYLLVPSLARPPLRA